MAYTESVFNKVEEMANVNHTPTPYQQDPREMDYIELLQEHRDTIVCHPEMDGCIIRGDT